jgi:hypothetical protein
MVEVIHIPGTKDNQHRVSNPVPLQDSRQLADNLVSAADSSALEAGTRDMGDKVDTLVEREAPPMETRAMSRSHARGE